MDLNVRRLRDSDLEWADMVFASAMIVQQDSLREVIDRCKARGASASPSAARLSRQAMEHVADADFLFPGEAETTVPEFLHDLELGVPQHVYQADEKPDLTKSPVPDFTLVRHEPLLFDGDSVFARLSVQLRVLRHHRNLRARAAHQDPTSRCLRNWTRSTQTGWRGPLFIVDDNFIGNKKNVRLLMPDLCEWMERHKQPFSSLHGSLHQSRGR